MTDNFQHKLLLLKIFHEKLNNFLYKIEIENIDENDIGYEDLEYLDKIYSLISTHINDDTKYTCKSNKSINRLSSIDFIEISEVNDELIMDNSDLYVKCNNNPNKFENQYESECENDIEKRNRLAKENNYIDDTLIILDDINDEEDDENIELMIESIMNNNINNDYIPLRDNPCSKKCSFNDSNFDAEKLMLLN